MIFIMTYSNEIIIYLLHASYFCHDEEVEEECASQPPFLSNLYGRLISNYANRRNFRVTRNTFPKVTILKLLDIWSEIKFRGLFLYRIPSRRSMYSRAARNADRKQSIFVGSSGGLILIRFTRNDGFSRSIPRIQWLEIRAYDRKAEKTYENSRDESERHQEREKCRREDAQSNKQESWS